MLQLTRQNKIRKCKIDRIWPKPLLCKKDAVTVTNHKLAVNQQYSADIKITRFSDVLIGMFPIWHIR